MGEAVLASLLAGLATGVGALPILFLRKVSHKLRDSLLAFAAGVMVAASCFNLIVPALNEGTVLEVCLGIIAGTIVLGIFERYTPDMDYEKYFGNLEDEDVGRRAVLLITAITLHNIPEGLAVGVGFASNAPGMGVALAIAIAVQNAPEGLVVAAPLVDTDMPSWKIIWLATLTGLVEPIAAIFGSLLVRLTEAIIPFALSFSAGAMLYVVFKEMIPESHVHGYEDIATYSFVLGVVFMLAINYVFLV